MSNPLYSLLATHADSDAVLFAGESGSDITYAAFFDTVARAAGVLVSQGVGAGDRVALQTVKSIDALAVYVACAKIGAAFLPLNTAYTLRETRFFLEDAGVTAFITSTERAENLAAEGANEIRVSSLDASGSGSFCDAMPSAEPHLSVTAVTADDLGAILYTSGTTGRSKGAMLSQGNLESNTRVLVDYWQFTADDCLLHALPIYHTHGLFVACNVVMATGASMIFQPSFDVDAVLQMLPQANTMMGVPTFYTRLLDDERFNVASTEHMRLFTSGSAPMLAETHVQFADRTGLRILERYGMTETGMLTSNPYASADGQRKPGTVGLPLPGVSLRIIDEQTGKEADNGSIGMIEVSGPNVFCGYWNLPEKTAEEFADDGFFITGDLGFLDDDGYVTIVGRNKDLIISGGFNVYPKEVELLIDEVDGIRESAVIGLPHADFGEAVTAVLVVEDNVDNAAGEEPAVVGQIKSHLSSDLAKFKQPKQYVVLSELPRNAMGKVQKNRLREQFDSLYRG